MIEHPPHPGQAQRGIVLISSLLLLLVVTIMAVAIFRSFGLQERIAGNTREKQRALEAATSAQKFAELWIANASKAPYAVAAGVPASADVTCTAGSVLDANLGQGQICTLPMTNSPIGISPTNVPWTGVGVEYTPPGMGTRASPITNTDSYYDRPRFYITDLGEPAGGGGGKGELYQIDAYSYGTSATTVAVGESTVAITCIVCGPGGL